MNIFKCQFIVPVILCLLICTVSWSETNQKRYDEGSILQGMTESQIRSKLQEYRNVRKIKTVNQGIIRKYRLELAKRGDQGERQALFSELKSEDMAKQAWALEDVAQLGDKEAIAQLGAMLDDPSEGGRYTRDHAFLPPRMVAAMKLADIIKSPPVPPIGPQKKYYTKDDVEKWQIWWESNKEQYGTLNN